MTDSECLSPLAGAAAPAPARILLFPRGADGALTARLYPAGGVCRGLFYAHLSGQDEAAAAAALAGSGAALCALAGEDWERDLSPWAAPRAFRKGSDFAGGGPKYLAFLCETVLSAAEAALGLDAPVRGIAGYSLAGLFALWAAVQRPEFSIAASMSGSLWYDGFLPQLEHTPHAALPRYAYLSLGDAEPRTRDARMVAVGDCTRRAAAFLAANGAQADFVWESGSHFHDIPARCARGLQAAAQHLPK